jgi:hypothetical protein
MRIPWLRRLGGTVLAVALTACGGSGGGEGGGDLSNADLVGTYFAFQFSGTDDTTINGFTATGTFTADGMGDASRTYVANDMGTVSGPISQPFTYDVAADGALVLSPGLLVSARGGLSADGEVALLGMTAPNFNPGVMALFRRSGILDTASLTGAYHMAFLRVSPATGDTVTFTGPVAFDGSGGVSFTDIAVNGMGAQTTSTSTFTYTVAGDGASTATIGAAVFPGGVVSGGDLAIWGGSTTAAQSPGLLVVARAATSASLATFQGDYWIVRLARNPVLGGYASSVGSATADGAGGLSLELTTNDEGTVISGAGTTTYTVAGDGALTIGFSQPLPGGITEDGRFAVLGGASGTAASPSICLLVRK